MIKDYPGSLYGRYRNPKFTDVYDNPFLDEWKDKYKIHYLNGDYVNCNYHKIDRSKDVEVLITNY